MSFEPVKSVRRIFEILELFDEERRPLSANEIARRLNYPLTSAHALMKSMHALGYAEYDEETWSYLPARLLPNILEWVSDLLAQEPTLLRFLAALSHATQETINVSRLAGHQARIIYGLESTHPIGVSVKVGISMPATQSLTGITLLAALDDQQRDSYFERLKTRSPGEYLAIKRPVLNSVFAEIKERGAAIGCDFFVPGIGAICMPVRLTHSDQTIVVGIVGPSDRIKSHETSHRNNLRALVSDFEIQPLYRLRNRVARTGSGN